MKRMMLLAVFFIDLKKDFQLDRTGIDMGLAHVKISPVDRHIAG